MLIQGLGAMARLTEDGKDPGNSHGWIDDDFLSGSRDSDEWFRLRILLSDQSRDIGLDATASDADEDHGDEKTRECEARFDKRR
jgi:hypothetical protein